MSIDRKIAELAEIRTSLESACAMLAKFGSAPVDRKSLEARIDRMIDIAAQRGPTFSEIYSTEFPGYFPYLGDQIARDPLAALAKIAPDQLRAAILADAPPGGVSDRQREDGIASAEAEKLALEIAEELTLRAIDGALGSHQPRREDAPPAILVAPLAELEAAARPAKAGGLLRRAS